MTKFQAKKILVPVDFSEFNDEALEAALDLAKGQDGKIALLHVMMELRASVPYDVYIDWKKVKEEISKDAEVRLLAIVKDFGLSSDSSHALVWGDPATIIAKYANENGIDLIVMSTHGRTGVGRLFMGSVAESVIRHSPCPVMVIRNSKVLAA